MSSEPLSLSWSTALIGWLVLVALYFPPTLVMTRTQAPHAGVGSVLLGLALVLLPWVAAASIIFRLIRHAPFGEGTNLRSAAMLIGGGVVILPIVSMAGTLLSKTTLQFLATGRLEPDLLQAARPAAISAMYMTSIYAAVVGIAQTLLYLQRYRAREHALASVRLEALKARVDPHFLFNVLNAVTALGYRNASAADEALTKLAGILRRTLAEDRDFVPLAEEVAIAGAEMDLHRLIIRDDIDFSVELGRGTETALVPTLILRPLVENAITHGAEVEGRRRVALRGTLDQGRLRLTLANDATSPGKGPRGLGSGIDNVRARLDHHYGADATFETCDREAEFSIRLSLPLMQRPESR